MTVAGIDYTYDYAFASQVSDERVQLATCGGVEQNDRFFHGRLRQPSLIGDLLGALATIVRTRFHPGRPPDLDPVVTSSPAMLRFEGFSGCCGAYVRVDLDERAFDTELQAFGTTNVDFNEPMRRELGRLREGDAVELSVGRESVELHRDGRSVRERKVRLPIRWIKAFGEVQVYQASLARQFEVPADEFRRFLQSLPRQSRQAMFVTRTGSALRLSQRARSAAVPLHGPERLRVLEPLLRHVQRTVVWLEPESGASGWQLVTAAGSFWLFVSPEMYRGFSGEGQLLSRLAGRGWEDMLPDVQAALDWQTTIDPAEIASRLGRRVADVEGALAVLGARGLAGFDADTGFYFHRRLPFDLEAVERLQPRLRDARQLLDAGKARLLPRQGEEGWDVEVQGSDVAHSVRLRAGQDTCSCPWFSRHQGARGPCKHLLAARMLVDDAGEPS